jgi:hypothetical protein
MLKSLILASVFLIFQSSFGIKPNIHSSFKLTYMYSGLGSNIGSKQPVFKVKGTTYKYSLEQNSS